MPEACHYIIVGFATFLGGENGFWGGRCMAKRGQEGVEV